MLMVVAEVDEVAAAGATACQVMHPLTHDFCVVRDGGMQAWGLGLTWAFLVISLVALAASRALNVYPMAALINFMRPKDVAIPRTHMHMMWFSGLRGAIAFALSLSAAADLGGWCPSAAPSGGFIRLSPKSRCHAHADPDSLTRYGRVAGQAAHVNCQA